MKNQKTAAAKYIFVFAGILLITGTVYAQVPYQGAEAVLDIYSAAIAGPGGFTTSTGSAPFSALNPAQSGSANRMIFDASYLAIPAIDGMGRQYSEKIGYLQTISAGALFPTKAGVFGASLRYIGGFEDNTFNNDYFPFDPHFSGNIFAAKEVYPGMSLGIGFNFGFGSFTTIAGDLGFRYNVGRLGILDNFTIGVVLRGLGVTYYPSWLTPIGGISFDLLYIRGKNGKRDPLVLSVATDIGFPSLFSFQYFSFLWKIGLNLTIADFITVSASWPGGSGLNTYEWIVGKADPSLFPSIGLAVNIPLPSAGDKPKSKDQPAAGQSPSGEEKSADTAKPSGARLPSDGDLLISTAFKPLYEGITAIGAGVSWYAGLADKKPPVITINYLDIVHFSPNHDGKADNLEIPLSIVDQNYVVSYAVEIKNEKGEVVRLIENKEQRFEGFKFKEFITRLFTPKKQIDIPSSITWDGLQSTGELAPDGTYSFTVTATDDSGNTAVTESYKVVLRNKLPEITITPLSEAQRIFDPKGQGGNSSVTFTPRGSEEEAWESGIYNSAGARIRTFDRQSGSPRSVTWNGRNDSGQNAPDGVYFFRISTTTRAQLSASAEITNIILDSREAGALITSSVTAIAPLENQSSNLVNFSIRLLMNDGVDHWRLELRDQKGKVQRTFTGASTVPSVVGWNGLTDSGEIYEDIYTPEFTVHYTRGDVIRATATTVLVDVTGPVLTLRYTPEYFSPDNDGDGDELIINLSAADASAIADWSIEIRPVESLTTLFRKFEGKGSPTSRIAWDGRSDKGELVQSASFYQYTFTAADALGNESSTTGRLITDVLVIREGDRLKIQVPSIQFRPNFADFVGLEKGVVDNNNRIIKRIAEILNRFRDYKVQVEGHANPTLAPGAARDREEPQLKSISEARAKAIVDQLVRNGVARSRLTATGAGGSKPVSAFEDRENWWKNRRVEFYLIK